MSDDDILDSYLSGDSDISDLYQQSKQDPKGPAVETDHAILAAAKRSVGTGPEAAKRRLRPSWLVPASVAATLVLSTSIYLTNQPLIDPAADFAPRSYNGSYDESYNRTSESENLRQPPGTQPPLQKRALLGTPQRNKAQVQSEQAKSRPEKREESLAPPASTPQIARDSAKADHDNDTMAADALNTEKTLTAKPLSTTEGTRMAEFEPRAPQPSAAQDLSSAQTLPEPDHRATVQRWLTEIERLMDLDQLINAQNELKVFQQKHPDQPLPERIKTLLQSPKQ